MTYGWIIMLALIGAVNLIGRVMAKRVELAAEAGRPSGSTGAETPPAPPKVVRPAAVVARTPAAGRAPSPRPSQSAVTPPVAAPASTSVSPQARPAVQVRVPTRVPRPRRDRTQGKLWNNRRLREAFIAAELLGPPRSIQPVAGSAHEVR